ncbi:hypothetical protein G6F22_020159 [Rhizopus arrhizus]|nr:hypothetical protein G6F22_020159 [Rhizopus arrhizus]
MIVAIGEGPDEGHPQAGRSRAGQADEPALVDHRHLGVEAGQAQRRAGGIQEGHGPADAAEQRVIELQPRQRPVVHHQRRGHAEADQVGQ